MAEPTDLPPAGWYPAADHAGIERYWDGHGWSDQTRPIESPAIATTPVPSIPMATPVPSSMAKPIGLALGALIAGIVAFLVGLVPVLGAILGIAAIVLGVLALRRFQPKGMAVTGIVLASVGVLASIGVTAGLGAAVTHSTAAGPVTVTSPTARTETPKPPATTPAPTRSPAAPSPTPSPSKTVEPAAPAAPTVPAEYKSALVKAASYSQLMHMSKAGLYDQLTSEYGEQFSAEAAQYAVDNVQVDWNANALAKAKEYQSQMSMSPEAIRDQLTSEYGEQFTPEEADYAIQHLND